MRKMSASAYFWPPFYSIFVAAALLVPMVSTQVLHAQTQTAPVAGTSVVVRMMDAVDSVNDPSGKQYRASVTKAVDAGNGVTILRGALAVVSLVNSGNGSGWTAQLVSVTINGQPIAVASSSASVTSAAQSAASNAASSILNRFGHHGSVPSEVTAVAMGQRVVLPLGTTLTFVLSQPPTTNAAASAPVAQPMTAAATPSPSPATNSTGGAVTAMYICASNPPPTPSDSHHEMEYLTGVFEVPLSAISALEPAFADYLKSTYNYPRAGITCQSIWTIKDAQAAQKSILTRYSDPRLKRIDTGWRYGQPPLTQGQSGFDPLAQRPSGPDLSQHRLTTYFCSFTAPGGTTMAVDTSKPNWNANMTTYVSPVFQADWDSAAVDRAYNVYIRDHYVHDLPMSDLSTRCTAQSPAMQEMQHQSAMISNKRIGHAVAVDFTDTAAQAAEGNAAESAAAAHAAAQQAASSTSGPFISCSTTAAKGVDTYFTGIFQTTRPIKRMPNGSVIVDRSILDDFHAYLKQKGYNFEPGKNSGCDVKPTEAEAKAAQHTRAYGGGGGLGVNCCGYGKIVETGWKDTP